MATYPFRSQYPPPKQPSEQYLRDKAWLNGFINASNVNPSAVSISRRKQLIQAADQAELEYVTRRTTDIKSTWLCRNPW
jgi:hypothetical protein